MIAADDPTTNAARAAIHGGDVATLEQLLTANPTLATERFGDDQMSCTLLHMATDWPANFPNSRAIIELLVARGTDVDGRFAGPHDETALHWAASSDDVEALDALLDAGADIEARGAVLGGGAPIADAVGFAQWKAARRLIERGATTVLWESAGLGLMDRVRAALAADPPPPTEDLTQALWLACQGGQLEAAVLLVDHGADITWVGYDHLTPLDAAMRSEARDVASWLHGLGAPSARTT
jgi:ankyrin repeat protein